MRLLWLIAGIAVLPACRGCGKPPDVLLIVVDTLRADALGVYGESQEVSPNLDAFAATGARFARAIAASGYTVPSHASIFTGRYPRRHSIGYSNGGIRLRDEPTWAEQLAAAGYDTAAFISNMNLKKKVGLNRGFALYDDRLSSREANRTWMRERVAPDATAAAADWLRRPRDRPFFAWVHYQDPHGPYTPPADWRGRLRGSRAGSGDPLPELDNHFGRGGVPGYQRLEDAATLDDYHGRYLAETAYADQAIGELLRVARAVSERDLLVIFTSDHGESFGEESFYFAHGHTGMPDLARVPLLVSGPAIEPGVFRTPVSHVDLLPTVLGLLELPPVAGVDGRDLSDDLRRGQEPEPAVVFCDVGYEIVAYRGDQILRVAGPTRSVQIDNLYKSGRAARQGRLLGWPSISSTRGYRWGDDFELSTEAEAWGLRAYLAGETGAGAAVSWTEEEVEALRAIGYIGTP